MYAKYHINYNHVKNPVEFNDTTLIQIGRLYCTPSAEISKHAHMDWYELTVVTGGKGIIYTNDIPCNVEKGDIYLSCPGDFHNIVSSEENPLKYDFFSFYSKNPDILLRLKEVTSSLMDVKQRVVRNEDITSNISNAIAEYSEKNEYRNEIISAILEHTIFLVLRAYSNNSNTKSKKQYLTNDELCYQIMYHIDTHIYSISKLSSISEYFSYNYSYLSDLFKKTTGNTILNYFHNRRLDAAMLLIKEGNFKIKDIAEKLNYSSLYAFSKAFKKKYNMSPKAFGNAKYDK